MFNSFSRKFWLGLIGSMVCLPGLASAQIGYTPAAFARTAGGTLVEQSVIVKNSVVKLNTLAGQVYTIEYRGLPNDLQTAAWVMGVTLNMTEKDDLAGYENILKENNSGTVKLSGRIVEIELTWGTSLTYTIKPRLYRNFGQDRHQLGKSAVVIRQFTDYTCGPCRQFSLQVLPKLMTRYINPGQASYSLRNFPLNEVNLTNNHPAMAAECASSQGKFFEYHNALLINNKDVFARAKELKLDMASFQNCLKDQHTLDLINADASIGDGVSVAGTPTIFVGPFQMLNAWDIEAYDGYIKMAAALGM
jgi:hypothetical protein